MEALGEDAALDYFPDELIPFAGSEYCQATEVELAPNAVLVMSEIVTAGRIERGEHLAFTRLMLDVRCSAGEMLRIWDRADLRPATQRLRSRAILGDATVWGTVYVLTTRTIPRTVADALHATLQSVEAGYGGASLAPLGLVGRVVGTSLDGVREAFRRVRGKLWNHFSLEGLGS